VNFLNIGTLELMMIIAIAILVIGPKRMVQVARSIGRMATRMRQISGEFTSIIRSELSELDEARQEVQAAVGELAGSGGSPQAPADVTDAVKSTKDEADQSMQSLLDDGLGLSQIASELRATATEARRFVRKAAEAEAQDGTGDGEEGSSSGTLPSRRADVDKQAMDSEAGTEEPQSTAEPLDAAGAEGAPATEAFEPVPEAGPLEEGGQEMDTGGTLTTVAERPAAMDYVELAGAAHEAEPEAPAAGKEGPGSGAGATGAGDDQPIRDAGGVQTIADAARCEQPEKSKTRSDAGSAVVEPKKGGAGPEEAAAADERSASADQGSGD
jgi:sec-independent protein translocase protein TatB